jgi:hypothetical protein
MAGFGPEQAVGGRHHQARGDQETGATGAKLGLHAPERVPWRGREVGGHRLSLGGRRSQGASQQTCGGQAQKRAKDHDLYLAQAGVWLTPRSHHVACILR